MPMASNDKCAVIVIRRQNMAGPVRVIGTFHRYSHNRYHRPGQDPSQIGEADVTQ